MSGSFFTYLPKEAQDFSTLAQYARARSERTGDTSICDLVSQAALLSLEEKVPFPVAWNRIRAKAVRENTHESTHRDLLTLVDPESEGDKTSTWVRHASRLPKHTDSYPTEQSPEPDPLWLEIFSDHLYNLSKCAPTGTEKAHARRALAILEIICERIDDEEYSNESDSSFVFQPRKDQYFYLISELAKRGESVSVDHLKHTFVWMRNVLQPIARIAGIQIVETRGKK